MAGVYVTFDVFRQFWALQLGSGATKPSAVLQAQISAVFVNQEADVDALSTGTFSMRLRKMLSTNLSALPRLFATNDCPSADEGLPFSLPTSKPILHRRLTATHPIVVSYY